MYGVSGIARNATTSNPSVVDTLHDRIVRKGVAIFLNRFKNSLHVLQVAASIRREIECNAIRYVAQSNVTQQVRSAIVAR